MSENPWPNEWPDPQKTKKSNPAASQTLSASTTSIAVALIVVGVVLMVRNMFTWLAPPDISPQLEPPIVSYEPQRWGNELANCTINFITHEHNCHQLTALRFERPLRDGRSTVRLTLDPFTTGYTGARFAVTYGETIQGTTLNIGDSATNNGFAGDAGTQSNDAELHVINRQLIVYGNDYTQPMQTIDGHRQITAAEDVILPNSTIFFEVGNHKLWWLSENGRSELVEGPFLYALARQPDEEGGTNYEIYAAFNQVVDGSRIGRGVEEVVITLIPAE